MTWRESSREEIKRFYRDEFPGHIDHLPPHLNPPEFQELCLAFDQPYPTKKKGDRKFIRRPTRDVADDGKVRRHNFTGWKGERSALEFIQRPTKADPLKETEYGLAEPDFVNQPAPLPHGVYYSLEHWERPWVLAVDIDAKDVARQRVEQAIDDDDTLDDDTVTELLEQRGTIDAPPEGKPYTFADIRVALEYGFEVKTFFEEDLWASRTGVLYSGQGAHVYLLDAGPYNRYDQDARKVITDYIARDLEVTIYDPEADSTITTTGVPIDEQVTPDQRRVMRMPYSLHTGVSRVVTPVPSPDFNFRENAKPEFLGRNTALPRFGDINADIMAGSESLSDITKQMMAQTRRNRAETAPSTLDDEEEERVRIAALAHTYDEATRAEFLQAGIDQWAHEDGTPDREGLIDDIEVFGTYSFEEAHRSVPVEEQLHFDPRIIAAGSVLAACSMNQHPVLQSTPPKNIKLLSNVRELFSAQLTNIIRETASTDLILDLGEQLYYKRPDEEYPYPGRVCSDVIYDPDRDADFVKLMLVAASPKAMAWGDEKGWGGTFDEKSKTVVSDTHHYIEHNALHVPVEHAEYRLWQEFKKSFAALFETAQDMHSAEQLTWLRDQTETIQQKIDAMFEANQTDLIWKNWNSDKKFIQFLRNVIEDHDEFDTGDYLTANDIFRAVEEYAASSQWERLIIDKRITSPRGIGNKLADLAEDGDYPIDIKERTREHKYYLGSPGRAKQIAYTDLEDIFELPCMAAMRDRLAQKGPTRQDLLHLAAMVAWLKGYPLDDPSTPSKAEIISDVKDLFAAQPWDWYDPDLTEQNMKADLVHGEDHDGQHYFPPGCDNDHIQANHCIGKDQCPYSIWGSLPFPQEMYDQVGDGEAGEYDGF